MILGGSLSDAFQVKSLETKGDGRENHLINNGTIRFNLKCIQSVQIKLNPAPGQ
jgi:hypothetical protein